MLCKRTTKHNHCLSKITKSEISDTIWKQNKTWSMYTGNKKSRTQSSKWRTYNTQSLLVKNIKSGTSGDILKLYKTQSKFVENTKSGATGLSERPTNPHHFFSEISKARQWDLSARHLQNVLIACENYQKQGSLCYLRVLENMINASCN